MASPRGTVPMGLCPYRSAPLAMYTSQLPPKVSEGTFPSPVTSVAEKVMLRPQRNRSEWFAPEPCAMPAYPAIPNG